MELDEVLVDYGCNINKFTNLPLLKQFINRFNKHIDRYNISYNLCKDDAGVFVLVSNLYVVKIYKKSSYDKIISLYSRINNLDHIEIVYYFLIVEDGKIIHSTFDIDDTHGTIYGTINELLIPLFNIKGIDITSNFKWDWNDTYKLLLDVSQGLYELHKNNIVHGDSTPDNTGFRMKDNNYVLFDFGDSSIENNKDKFRNDVNRFLNSMMITYAEFFDPFKDQIIKIQRQVNTGSYSYDKFYNIMKI
uniref:Putative serine/threonine protein kinase n=1 Tax=Pithovirus LCPAC302 TaxID=2506593 RepID=A0A481Z7U5_9VIRU|nr:MAG: putative serine/threonine protein kinase [Pithovirus LCPAC302]